MFHSQGNSTCRLVSHYLTPEFIIVFQSRPSSAQSPARSRGTTASFIPGSRAQGASPGIRAGWDQPMGLSWRGQLEVSEEGRRTETLDVPVCCCLFLWKQDALCTEADFGCGLPDNYTRGPCPISLGFN